MKKIGFLVLMLIALLMLTLCACDMSSTSTPTEAPTNKPIKEPIEAPTSIPTEAPTAIPTEAPTEPTTAPVECYHKYDSWEITTYPSCNQYGVRTYTCAFCGNKKTETVNKTTEHTFDNGVVTKQATCFQDGVKTYTCNNCSQTKTESISQTDHKYENNKCIYCDKKTEDYIYGLGETWVVEGQWEFTVDMVATHDECKPNSIIITFTYNNIGYDGGMVINLRNDWNNEVYFVSNGQIVCMETHNYTSCKHEEDLKACVIGGSYTGNVVFYADDNYDIDEVTIEMRKEKANETKYIKAIFNIPVHTHEYDSGTITTAATCGNDGVKTYTCKTCPHQITETIPTTGSHNIVNNVCTVCGFKPVAYCDADLPVIISYYTSSGTKQSSCSVTDVTFKVSGGDLYIYFTGRKTYDSRGSGQSDSCKIGWKLYDEDDYVIASGTAYTLSLATGEGFKEEEERVYNVIESGKTYRLVLLNVN